jgi:phosphatidylserine/phosphatidylglycerophosphate/cardiolipin synthase-like enzyme
MKIVSPAKESVVWARPGTLSGYVNYCEQDGNYVQWLVDGREAMYEMCEAFCRATKFIYLIDSYFKPDVLLVRSKNDFESLCAKSAKHRETLEAVKDLNKKKEGIDWNKIMVKKEGVDWNKIMGSDKDYAVPLISLLTVKANQGVKVRIVIFHPDSLQEHFGGHFGWLEGWAIVKFWSDKIDLKLAMMGMRKEGHEVGAHHQKSAVVCAKDNQGKDRLLIGFCGGVDLAADRWALPSHNLLTDPIDNRNPEPSRILGRWNGKDYKTNPGDTPLWHDVHVKVIGPAAYDLALNFVQRYSQAETNLTTNDDRKAAANDFAKKPEYEVLSAKEGSILLEKLEKDTQLNFKEVAIVEGEVLGLRDQSWVSADLLSSDESYSQGRVWAQIVRTYTPAKAAGDYGIWDVYKNLFRVAQKNVYIENQYAFKNDGIFDVLASNLESKGNKLKVIIVAPVMPDNYDYDINQNILELITVSSSDISRLHTIPERARAARVAAYSLSSYFDNARIPIYVHAKLAVVDDTWAIVGSANLDSLGVSHAWKLVGSSEIAILVNGRDQVLALRRQLVKEHLGPKAPSEGKIDNFDDVYEAFIDAADQNGPPNSTKKLLDGVQIVFHRAYQERLPLPSERAGSLS